MNFEKLACLTVLAIALELAVIILLIENMEESQIVFVPIDSHPEKEE